MCHYARYVLFEGRCRVIATPGHTPEHISLYVPELDSVMAGDAAVNKNGRLAIANPNTSVFSLVDTGSLFC